MILIGIICLVAGYIVPISALITVGWLLVVLGIVLTILGAAGHGLGGRKTYF